MIRFSIVRQGGDKIVVAYGDNTIRTVRERRYSEEIVETVWYCAFECHFVVTTMTDRTGLLQKSIEAIPCDLSCRKQDEGDEHSISTEEALEGLDEDLVNEMFNGFIKTRQPEKRYIFPTPQDEFTMFSAELAKICEEI